MPTTKPMNAHGIRGHGPQRHTLASGLVVASVMATFVTLAGGSIARQDLTPSSPSVRGKSQVEGASRSSLMILDNNLRTIALQRLSSFTSESITYVDMDGQERRLEREGVLALVPRDWAESLSQPVTRTARSDQAVLRLADGVTLMGTPALTDADEAGGESLTWDHRVLREFTFKLDQILSIDLAARDGEPPALTAEADALLDTRASSADTILLRNAERLRGFVAGFQPGVENGRGAPAISIEIDKVATVVPLARVRAISLSNPRTRSGAITISLGDGSVISASTLTFGDDKTFVVAIERSGQPVQSVRLTNDSLQAALLSPRRLVTLASLTPQAPPVATSRTDRATREVTVIAEPEPLDLRSVLVSGAAEVRWAIPSGAVRFGAMLVLPDDARPLGAFSCSLDVLNDRGATLPGLSKEHSLSSKSPSGELLIELPPEARSIRFRTVQGASGPVQVGVLLRRAAFVLKP